ncbi:uncharacterized protein LOC120016760 isoform X2 [Tripterygium wilfordii]|uniref:uncharacterized protein LOC120016760 isoform X2 n=1 Tax=Tripterygium wilfordii TaxID=458696 RepID=UPI0018F85B28|nr:uncharacterized protein LOC120016760 isoform X2 [Tripterygium wilfordii]XP_038725603.1 uncharacterized protein LOC120016760 isoform X2 [Tripterygium wilfordii]
MDKKRSMNMHNLMHVEKSTVGRDLGPVTDKLWKNFYERQFGRENTDLVVERMKQKNVSFRWIQLYEAKSKDMTEAMNKSVDRLKQLYKDEDARKQKRTIQLCSKVPPSSKRRFFGESGPGNLSHIKSNLMRKAKSEFLNSREVQNIAAMRKNAVQRNNRTSPMMKPGGSGVKNFASASRHGRS